MVTKVSVLGWLAPLPLSGGGGGVEGRGILIERSGEAQPHFQAARKQAERKGLGLRYIPQSLSPSHLSSRLDFLLCYSAVPGAGSRGTVSRQEAGEVPWKLTPVPRQLHTFYSKAARSTHPQTLPTGD